MPTRQAEGTTSKMDSHFTPSEGTKFDAMPCTRGGAPVSMEEKQVTVRAGYTVSQQE
jgi:hypothetical protein